MPVTLMLKICKSGCFQNMVTEMNIIDITNSQLNFWLLTSKYPKPMETWLYGQYSIRTKLPHEISIKLYFMIGLWLLLTRLFRRWQIFAMYKRYVDAENASMHDFYQFIFTNKNCCLSKIIKVGGLRPWSINDAIFFHEFFKMHYSHECSKLLWIIRFHYCKTT